MNNSVPMVGAHITAGDDKDEIKMCMKMPEVEFVSAGGSVKFLPAV